jgi:rhodanese-related sulfurtransferase
MNAPIALPNFPPDVPPPVTITDLVTRARSTLQRLEPDAAFAALHHGAVLADIRPAAQRAGEGEIPQALLVERSVLEWRFDPASEDRLPLASYGLHLVVLCSQGHTSSLAAATLQQLGVRRATDVIGGFRGWQSAGLPVVGGSSRPALALMPEPGESALGTGLLDVRPDERRVYAEGRELDLTRLEFDLLTHLVTTPHQVHTRSALLSHLWADRRWEGSRTVDVHVHRLRTKLGQNVGQGLQTVRGVGYRWSPPASGAA